MENTEQNAISAPLRVGIVGCGNISSNHLAAFEKITNTTVIGVCDVDINRARATAKAWNVEHALDSVEALLDLGLDIVSVCTPHPTHEEVVLAAAAAGVNVLCEKPIAVDLASAQRMVVACDAAGVKLGVLFQRRFWPAAQQLRAAIDDGTLGTPIMGQVSVLLHREAEYYSADTWRGTWANDGGGVLMTQAIHYIDLLQWYLGDIAEVYGTINTYKHGEHIEVEDSAAAVLRFTNGAIATLNASTAANPALGVQIKITGSTGATAELCEFPEGSDGRITIMATGTTITSSPAHPQGAEANVDLATINAALKEHHLAQIKQFAQAVGEDLEPSVTGQDASNALRILLAIYASSRTGEPVRFAPVAGTLPVPSDSVIASVLNPAPVS